MLNFVFLEKGLGIISLLDILYDFIRKMFLIEYSINWLNFSSIRFPTWPKVSGQKFRYLRTKRVFKVKQKEFLSLLRRAFHLKLDKIYHIPEEDLNGQKHLTGCLLIKEYTKA